MEVVESIGLCPQAQQPPSMQIQTCLVVLKDVARIVILDPDGADPFNDAAVIALGTQAALKANIEDKAIWDAAIALVTVDTLTLTPEIHDGQRPKVLIEPVELPDGTRMIPGTLPDVMGTYTSYGINSENHEALIRLAGTRKKFVLIDKAGNTIYKNLSDAEIANGDSALFTAKLFNVSTREVNTGAGNVDNMDIQLFSPFGEMVRFATAESSAFGLIL